MYSYSHGILLYRTSEPFLFIPEEFVHSCWVQEQKHSEHPALCHAYVLTFFFKVKRSSSERINHRITTRKHILWLLILNSIHLTLLFLQMVVGEKASCSSRTNKCLKPGPLFVDYHYWKWCCGPSSLKWEWLLCLLKKNMFQPTFIKFRIWWAVSFESLH